ncbi:hypothetical protein EYZ11_011499 [Aspergillus tanneri]|uniref:Carrier domain-containing protein n=1 Tax=Aspergillus tanneri TaxID=1220188 RepID=A0A4S3J2N5_9EURO|nr:hypothetical protein EYZ11_011499 [Aspergillus tanneri]
MDVTQDSEFDPRTQLIPHLIDHYARTKPDAIYAEYPTHPMSYDHGYRPITYRAFANAINGLAWWLTEKLGPGNGEILAYVGANDMFFTSPRNSVAAHNSLFQRLNCTKMVVPTPRPPPVTTILEAHKLDVLEVPGVDDLLSKEYPYFKYSKSFPEAASDKLAAIHTSGSTGIPKPIFFTHDSARKHMRMASLEPPEGFVSQDSWGVGKRAFLSLPPFHAAGIAYTLFIAPPIGMTIVCATSGGLPTGAGIAEAVKKTPFDAAIVVPSILQELAQNPELLDFISKNLGYLLYAGGDLPQPLGDTVASKIKLVNQFGASEVGMMALIHSKTNRDPLKDWRYLHFHPEMGVELRRVTDDEYELFMIRTPEREGQQVPFTMFPDLHEYSTKDLFVRHPDPNKPDLWRWSARADDVIVFLNGEKTNPVSLEQHITAANSEVSAALVAGARRFQASLLVELANTEKELSPSERAAVIEKIWPSIEEANAVCPAHARIAKTHILFTKPGKPMPRASKGTVQRAGALAAYAPELDALYADADQLAEADEDLPGPGRVQDAPVIAGFIRKTLSSITGWSKEQLSDEANFFDLGFDSLQAITATRRLKRGLDFPGLTPNMIYLYSSVSGLTQAVLQAQHNQETTKEEEREAQLRERNSLLQEVQGQINIIQAHTVVLTGSTGRLGTYLLDALLRNPSVTHVHCLNRKADSLAVQRQKFDAFGLEHQQLDPFRVSFWSADLTQKDLGVSPDVLQKLQNTATLVIHNAWAVNFNLSLPSFKPHLSGVANLINFCSSATKSPLLFFISSISSMLGHRTPSGLTPETVIQTATPAPNGYANSKYLAEQLLEHAARKRTVRASIARVGQVAGAVRTPGQWNKAEWFPSLVLSSLHVGAVPDNIGPQSDRIDWMPVDLLAEVLTELALGDNGSSGPVSVSHPVNLHASTWGDILPVVVDLLSKSSGKPLETIPSRDWLQRIRQDLESSAGGTSAGDGELQTLLEKNPAAKLLYFYEDIMSEQTEAENVLDTQLTAQRSEKLRSVEGVKREWVEKWVGEWIQ